MIAHDNYKNPVYLIDILTVHSSSEKYPPSLSTWSLNLW
jgi:hypothetical protein